MIEQLEILLKAHYPIIYLQSFEWFRIKSLVTKHFEKKGYKISSWDVVNGLNSPEPTEDTEDPVVAIREIYKIVANQEESDKKEIFLFIDFHEYLSNAEIRTRLRILSHELKYTQKHIVFIGPASEIPIELEKEIIIIEVPLPSKEELRQTLKQLLAEINHGSKINLEISGENEEKLVNAALGLTIHEADLAFSKALAITGSFSENSVKQVVTEKEHIIKKSKILEYYHTNEHFGNIGGLGKIKEWLNLRGHSFSRQAREFGLPEPKGVMLTGVPGCGKSLIAKAIASVWNMPLLRLDIGKVFEGLVGSSEQNIRKAILTAESIAPCILWIDEIEKGLSGMAGSGTSDSGTTARVFSTFLTWMQEKTKPVFIVATANNLDALPPELLRKGRFDEIFFIDLPTFNERCEILKIHVEKHKRTLTELEYNELSHATNGFNGSEIEAAITEALFIAFERVYKGLNNSNLTKDDIIQAIEKTVPLSTIRKSEIDTMRKIASLKFVKASSEPCE